MDGISWLAVAGLVFAVVGVCLWRPCRRAYSKTRLARAKRCFHVQREGLEARFVQLATCRHADAPQWADCTFADDVAYVRNRATGELLAFVAMTVPMQMSNRSPSVGADTVGNLQAGTAVFRFDRGHWLTDGRVISNLSPAEAVYHRRDKLEIVGEEFAHHR
jgi:hypothetical protein